jgi:hypothetical protein
MSHTICYPLSSQISQLLRKNKLYSKDDFCQAWWGLSIIPAIKEAEVGESQFKASPGKVSRTPYLKKKFEKMKENRRTGGLAQVVEHLPNKCKVLSSISSTAKKLFLPLLLLTYMG